VTFGIGIGTLSADTEIAEIGRNLGFGRSLLTMNLINFQQY
jgi:hypothetical protein